MRSPRMDWQTRSSFVRLLQVQVVQHSHCERTALDHHLAQLIVSLHVALKLVSEQVYVPQLDYPSESNTDLRR